MKKVHIDLPNIQSSCKEGGHTSYHGPKWAEAFLHQMDPRNEMLCFYRMNNLGHSGRPEIIVSFIKDEQNTHSVMSPKI